MTQKEKLEKLVKELQRLKLVKEAGATAGILNDLVESVDDIKGEKGDTPIKGVDYFTKGEIEEIIQKIIRIIEPRIRIPEDGKTPIAGVDYPSEGQIRALVTNLVDRIPRIKGDKGDPGNDGKDADEVKLAEYLLDKLNIAEETITKTLKEELEEFIREEIGKRPTRIGGGFSRMSMEQYILDPYVPTGAINGVNTDFVLSHTPSPATSLKVYLDGQLMSLTTDYTLSGVTITFLTAPLTNSIIKVEHRI